MCVCINIGMCVGVGGIPDGADNKESACQYRSTRDVVQSLGREDPL